MQKFIFLVMAALLALPMTALAASQEDAMMEELQKQIQALSGELEELSDRLDDTERHSTLDRIEFSGDLRARAHSIHYQDVTFNPGIEVNYTDFFNKVGMSVMMPPGSGAPLGDIFVFPPDPSSPLGVSFNPDASQGTALDNMFVNLSKNNPELFQQLMNSMADYMLTGNAPGVGIFPMAQLEKSDINNDIMYDSRLRLNMKAKVWDNVKFSGRLAMYKNWGDSTNAQVFDSWRSFSMDGNSTGNTSSDLLHVERAYMDWSNIADSGVYLSIGRRPSTYGPPTEIRENELRGGTPTGNVMNLNFDGITVGYNLSENTGIEGMIARFCYGQGFESEWGNGELFNDITTKDTHFAGFNFDLFNDGTNFLQTTIFTAQDINDGFKGTIAFPTQYGELFAPTLFKDMQKFPNFNFVTRVQPSTTIGDINLGGIVYTRTEDNGLKYFVSGGWTQLRPNGNAGMFGGMGTDAVFEAQLSADGTEVMMVPVSATEEKTRNGYGFYTGVQVPAPYGKVGLEYNYGSKYWTPFTQGQDDVLGSKLATRGHVGEAYYIFDINPNMFIKIGGLYYDFVYSNSGSPVGKPQKVDDVKDGSAYSLLPVIDTAYDLNASLTVKF